MGRAGLPRAVAVAGGVLGAGLVVLLGVTAAATQDLLPGQLDAAGREACGVTRSAPTAPQRAQAVALALRADEDGLRQAAGTGRYARVERWCAAHD